MKNVYILFIYIDKDSIENQNIISFKLYYKKIAVYEHMNKC